MKPGNERDSASVIWSSASRATREKPLLIAVMTLKGHYGVIGAVLIPRVAIEIRSCSPEDIGLICCWSGRISRPLVIWSRFWVVFLFYRRDVPDAD